MLLNRSNRIPRGLSEWCRAHVRQETRQGYVLVCLALWSTLSFLLISNFIYSSVIVLGESMAPTLRQGDRFVLNRWFHQVFPYERGELVVVREPRDGVKVIKRIVALPNETIELRPPGIYVNNRRLSEPYLPGNVTTATLLGGSQTLRLKSDEYFVMGDNRPVSLDSRFYGPVNRSDLLGAIVH